MRNRQQLELTPGQYSDAKKNERQQLLRELEGILERAFNHREPWYMWILWRRNGEHRHGLFNEQSEPVACPVPGCDDGHPSVGRHRVGIASDGIDPVDPPLATVEKAEDELAGLQLDCTVDLGVPVGAAAVVELDEPVPGLDHQDDSKP